MQNNCLKKLFFFELCTKLRGWSIFKLNKSYHVHVPPEIIELKEDQYFELKPLGLLILVEQYKMFKMGKYNKEAPNCRSCQIRNICYDNAYICCHYLEKIQKNLEPQLTFENLPKVMFKGEKVEIEFSGDNGNKEIVLSDDYDVKRNVVYIKQKHNSNSRQRTAVDKKRRNRKVELETIKEIEESIPSQIEVKKLMLLGENDLNEINDGTIESGNSSETQHDNYDCLPPAINTIGETDTNCENKIDENTQMISSIEEELFSFQPVDYEPIVERKQTEQLHQIQLCQDNIFSNDDIQHCQFQRKRTIENLQTDESGFECTKLKIKKSTLDNLLKPFEDIQINDIQININYDNLNQIKLSNVFNHVLSNNFIYINKSYSILDQYIISLNRKTKNIIVDFLKNNENSDKSFIIIGKGKETIVLIFAKNFIHKDTEVKNVMLYISGEKSIPYDIDKNLNNFGLSICNKSIHIKNNPNWNIILKTDYSFASLVKQLLINTFSSVNDINNILNQ